MDFNDLVETKGGEAGVRGEGALILGLLTIRLWSLGHYSKRQLFQTVRA